MMAEKEKVCPVCGKKGDFKGFACDPCQDKIRREALGERKKIKEDADKEIKKYGGKGD